MLDKLMCLALCFTIFPSGANASSLETMLVVKGSIGVFNNKEGTEYRFTESDLLKLPQHRIVTKTTWTPRSTFSGPLVMDILKAVKAKGREINVVTFDEYKVAMPISDSYKYKSIMARTMNGKPLQRKDFGPLWIMYPVDDFSELQTVKSDAKLVWQVKYIVVR